MHRRFREQLLIVFAPLIALALISVMYLSWQAATVNIRANAEEQLQIAERVLEELLANDHNQLRERASLLAEDFGFRRAIATGESETIVSVLANHGERVDADMMFLLNSNGRILESTHDLTDVEGLKALLGGDSARLLVSDADVYQVVVVPVRAPDLIGWVGMGFLIDQSLADSLKRLTLTDVSFLFDDGAGSTRLISTLQLPPELNGAVSAAVDQAKRVSDRLEEDDTLTHYFSLRDTNTGDFQVLLSTSLNDALLAWAPWRRQLFLIACLAFVVTAITAWLVARSVTRPVHALMQAADRIGRGDYSRSVDLNSSNEFGVLADTLNDMQSAIGEREKHILFQARHHAISTLPMRDYFGELIAERTQGRGDPRYALILIRISKLQNLAEAYGDEWCDELVRLSAQRLRAQLRRKDILGHIDRDQFMIFGDDMDATGASHMVAHIVESMQSVFQCRSIEVKVDVRIGVVLSPSHGTDYGDLLRRASIAMAKGGRGVEGAMFYEDGQDLHHMRQIRVTQRLQRAIHGSGLELNYQPKFDLHSNRVTQVEALLRWTDDELGKVFPDEFIPLAESSGDIVALSVWVLRDAAATARAWREQGIDLQIGVNISARDFLQPTFVERTMQILRDEGVEPSQMVLEVTESAAIDDVQRTIAHLTELRQLGFGLSMDDFGTGYSSLSQLKQLPLYELKIDKSFVLMLDSDEADQKIVRSTIELGHNLGMRVVAEGVENHASLELLRTLGCDAVQGYYLSRPMPRSELERFWSNHDANVSHMLQTAQGA